MAVRSLGRWRSTDMIGLRQHSPAWGKGRGRDQECEEGPEGELLCRIMQTGTDTWAGHDGRGRSLRIKRGRDGALEIRHIAETEDEADPDIVGTYPGAGGDPARAAGRTGDAPAPVMIGGICSLADYNAICRIYRQETEGALPPCSEDMAVWLSRDNAASMSRL